MDTVFAALGWRGRYQRIQFFLLLAPILDCALHLVSFIFIGVPFPHTCVEVQVPYPSLSKAKSTLYSSTNENFNTNLSVTYGACDVKVFNQSEKIYESACVNGYDYAAPRERSFVAEWDLVCEKSALPEVSQTVLVSGMLVGAFLFAFLSDRFGRRPVFVVCHVLYFAIAIVTALMPNYASFVCMRFLQGAVQQGTGVTSGIMLLELIPTERRALAIQASSVLWSTGLLVQLLVCYLCRDLSWRYTQLALAGISCYSLIQFWFVEESIRWLSANNKHGEAEKLIRKAAKTNGADPDTALQLYREEQKKLLPNSQDVVKIFRNRKSNADNCQGELMPREGLVVSDKICDPQGDETETTCYPQDSAGGVKFSAFFKNRKIFIITVIVVYIWISDNVAYIGLLLLSSSLVNDLYLGFALSVFAEIPAAIAFIVLLNQFNIGRRQLTILSHLLGGLCLLIAVILAKIPAVAVLPGVSTAIVIVSLIGKFGLCLGFNSMWLFTPELFPTTIRSTGYGIASSAARVGAMVAPYSITVARHVPWLPGVVFALLCLSVPFAVMILPETGETELPQTVEEMQNGNGPSKCHALNGDGTRRHDNPQQFADHTC
ncbi:hypothetical protein RRG08_045748 [Elysia crispata]|uniref:Major facilitator superfamily (MFS) profile domain-containing protein n=1 Tax=Elysia crispata TaxID=231223 RepID=A0AAE0Z9R2_9GAST|nr:hypothetical protein RRG08_045748 [Elysia crispata]